MVLVGAAGGLLPDAVRVFRERHDPAVPPFLKSPKFYVSLLIGVGLGALVTFLLAASNAKEAVAYGFAAPELLTKLAGSTKSPERTSVDRGAPQIKKRSLTIWEWWAA